jgi:hypothetical protein
MFQGNNDIVNAVEFTADSGVGADLLKAEGTRNQVLDPQGNVDLTFHGAGASGCGAWVNSQGTPSAPNCVYLIRAEQRFGNGDGLYTPAEQTRAFTSYYHSWRNRNFFLDSPRRMRLGLEVNF